MREARKVVIQPNLAAWLRAYPLEKNLPVVPDYQRRRAALAKELGLSHDVLRHTFISMFVAKFRSLGEAALQAGNSEAITINYFDTGGMPLAQLQVATAVALLSRMIGEAPDAETQQVRQAILARYIHQLYEDTFEEWSKRNRDKLPRIQRLACAAHRWKQDRMPAGSTEVEAYAELRDLLAAQDEQALEFVAQITEEQITAFLKHPQTERTVMQTAHAEYGPDD